MTPQEQQMIDGLIGRIRSTPVTNKDAEAEQHIQAGLATFPDALYVLVQTVLVQQYGLERAQAQIGELKQQVQTLQENAQQPAPARSSGGGGSFLSHLFGSGDSSTSRSEQENRDPSGYQPVHNPSSGGPGPGAGPGYAGQNYGSAPPSYNQPGYAAPGGYPPPPPYGQTQGGTFGGGGFLQGALQTAAGVAAGEMMFRGMEDLFSGFGGHGHGFAGGGGGETVVENNYFDDNSQRESRDVADRNSDDSSFYNPEQDASRSGFAGLDADDRGLASGDDQDFGGTGDDDSLSDDNIANDSDDDSNLNDDGGDFSGGGSDDFSNDA